MSRPLIGTFETPALVAGQAWSASLDATGAIRVNVIAGAIVVIAETATAYESGGDATSGVILAAPAFLFEVYGFNASASDRYFQMYNLVAVPADGAVPATTPVLVPSLTHFSLTFSEARPFTVGACWASSSTRATKTITGVADMWISALRRT